MKPADELTIEIGGVVVDGAKPEEAERVRALIEKAVATAARKLAGQSGGAAASVQLDDLRLELTPAQNALAPGAEAEIVNKLEAAILEAWKAAR